MTARGYTYGLVCALLALAGATLFVNLVFDPYRLRATRLALADHLLLRPDVYQFDRVNKAFNLRHSAPQMVLLGSSRMQWGISAGSSMLRARGEVFNLALSGPTFDEVRKAFDCVVARGSVRTIVLGLDFNSFNVAAPPSGDPFRCNADAWRLLNLYVSLRATRASGAAVMAALTDAEPATRALRLVLDDFGFSNASAQFDQPLSQYGHRQLFHIVEARFLDGYLRPYALTDRFGRSLLDDLRSVLATARALGIDLRLYFSPEHARQLEFIRATGQWQVYEDWKRAIVRVVDDEAKADGGVVPFPIWDFAAYHSIAIEPVPQMDDRTSRMRYFTDLSHFSPLVGDYILDRVLGNGEISPIGFGERVSLTYLEAWLSRVREGRDRYEASDPAEIADIEARVAARKRKTSADRR